jgi:UDP-N-acetylglucosamine--dolichyl-phosphate N-acetylglucosaminephosphotransferase
MLVPKLKTFLEDAGLVGTDVQKADKPKIAEMGGPAVIFGAIGGLFIFMWINTFLYGQNTNLIGLLAATTTFLIAGFIGMFDDLGSLIKKRESKGEFETFKRIGLKQWQKPLLTVAAAIPLMAVMAGVTKITIPLIGIVDLGIIYPLVLVPIAVVGASNALNLLAGQNGLEAGLGTVLMLFLGIFSYLNGRIEAAVLGFITFAALLAFLKFNWYPAKIFPGDSLPYAVGAIAAVIAVLGNIEKFALFLFAPWFLELFLKLRSKLKAQNFGILQSDGTLKAPYDKTYSITHAVMKLGRFREWQVSTIIVGWFALWCTIILFLSI